MRLSCCGKPEKRRLFVDPARWGAEIVLEKEEKHYLVDVLRLEEGERVEVFDGAGSRALARLAFREGKEWILKILESGPGGDRPAPVRLGLALTRGRRLDEVVRMVTEIGVLSIEPFCAERSVAWPGPEEAEKRRLRWQKIAVQAARQSGRSWVPEIHRVVSFEEILARRGSARGVILHPAAEECLAKMPEAQPEQETLLLVGPEGGFTEEECQKAIRAGFSALSLKLPVLRADTAAVVAAALTCLDYYQKVG